MVRCTPMRGMCQMQSVLGYPPMDVFSQTAIRHQGSKDSLCVTQDFVLLESSLRDLEVNIAIPSKRLLNLCT